MSELIPCWARSAAKLVLSRPPVDYVAWRKLNLSRTAPCIAPTTPREFRNFDEQDLLIKGFDVILRPA
jgi:hypothetical protein